MRPDFLRSVMGGGLAVALGLVASCGDSGTNDTTTTTSGSSSGDSGGGGSGAGEATTSTTTTPTQTTTTPTGPSACELLGLPERAFAEGPYGTHRNETAGDFTLELSDGTSWSFKEKWSGCESYIFVPDVLRVSDLDKTSIWEKTLDLAKLLTAPPQNVHYFFVSRAANDEDAKLNTDAMQARIDTLLAGLAAPAAEHWKERLHVVARRAGNLDSWIKDVLGGIGRGGFAIDRFQRVRGIGNLADVKRFKQALQDGGYWPWEQNLTYAAHEARYFNFEAEREARLEAVEATVIPFWDGETLAEFAEKDIDLPSEEEMAKFDTLEIDVTSMCQYADKVEFDNCGAWDYLAHLFVQDDAGNNVELGRFVTSYHRETRWVVDVSPMLVHLKKGGTRHFRWEFAPSFNTQPTATRLSLRLSNQGKGHAPSEATFLYGGGAFNATYNDPHLPIEVPIPTDAKRVELVAVITGHDAKTSQCAEFCNHQHVFKVNGIEHRKEHKEAGTTTKCIDHIEQGMVPNQGGTWWFGRGGWCPGQQVDPWVVDVTAEVTPGMTATIEYRGLFKNLTPPDGAGNIVMTSYLVVSR